MKTFEEYLIEEKDLLSCFDEAAYPGNIGVTEIVKFYQVANAEQKAEMTKITDAKDWEAFKKLIDKVLHVKLV